MFYTFLQSKSNLHVFDGFGDDDEREYREVYPRQEGTSTPAGMRFDVSD